MSKNPTVAVIGAGPAGLTTSKSMLAAGLSPTLFDSKPVVGGLWANTSSTPSSITVERRMRTNLSKYTCSFSDFDFGRRRGDGVGGDRVIESSVGVNGRNGFGYGERNGNGVKSGAGAGAGAGAGRQEEWDVFPAAEQLGGYLEAYAKTYLVEKGCEIKLQTEVTKIEKLETLTGLVNGHSNSDKPRPRWRVHYRNLSSSGPTLSENHEDFDFLALCSGFNARAHIPDLENASSYPGDIIHTSEYSWKRIHSACTQNPSPITRKHRIVIVGGSLSGSETAAELAIEISSLPEEEREKYEVVHVFARPFWVLPRYIPMPAPKSDSEDTDASHPPHFLPLDLLMYDLRRRNSTPPKTDAERYRLANGFIKSLVGTDQSDYTPSAEQSKLAITGEAISSPPWVAVSDSYQGFVRDGRIKTVLGRMTSFGKEGRVVRYVEAGRKGGVGSEVREIEDVDCVVMATGYTPTTALQGLLPPDIASALTGSTQNIGDDLEKDFTFLPILLYNHCLHPSLSRSAGFVGLYKGPYFAGLELQGRWLASLFSGQAEWPSDDEMQAGIANEKSQREARFKTEGLARSHRSRGEYVDMVLDLCKRLGVPLPNAPMSSGVLSSSLNMSPLLPMHLLSSLKEMKVSLTRFVEQVAHPELFVPVAVFRALHGKWSVSRIITSSTPGPMDGTFFGTARFTPRKATFIPGYLENNKSCGLPNRGANAPSNEQLVHIPRDQQQSESATVYEYLYREDGELTTRSGKVLSARRSYIYRLALSPTPRISAYFVKRDRTTADYFFHELEFYEDGGEDGDGASTVWKAKGEHLCSADWYWPEYMFHFGGAELLDFEIGYKVKGPKKEYTTTATYWR